MLKKLAILLSPDASAGGGAAAPASAQAAAAPAKSAAATPDPAAAADAGGDPNPFDALDNMIAKSRGKEPPKPEGDDKKGDLSDKTKEVEANAKKLADAPDPGQKRPESGPKALRDQLEKTNGELKTYREKAETLEKRIAEFEARGKDTTALAERLATVEKEKEAAIAEARALKHEAGPEFKAKYDAPIKRAADHAVSVVEQLTIIAQEAEDGSVIPARKATGEDMVRIFNMGYGDAQEAAEKLFGKAERIVMHHYQKLKDLHGERDAGLKELRSNWKAMEEKQKADAAMAETTRAQTLESIQSAWRQVNAEMVEKDPERYAAKPDDKEEAAIVTKAYELFDVKPKTWQQQVLKDANLRNRLASEALARHRLSKANDRIAELEAVLAESKGSRPGSTRTPGGAEKTTEKSWDQDLKEAMA